MRPGSSRFSPLSLVVAPRKLLAEVEVHVVTPMFGGGAEPGTVDAEQPVNGKSVRGALRFWWRACHGHQYDSAEKLFDAESSIWGQSARKDLANPAPSSLNVEVRMLNCGTGYFPPGEQPHRRWQDNRATDYPAYALFPFQYQQRTQRPALAAQIDVSFQVRLFAAQHVPAAQHADLTAAANSALWAWITFGGVGARTRRGCGALWSEQVQVPFNDPFGWLQAQATTHAPDQPVPNSLPIPVLPNSEVILHVGQQTPTPREAWKEAVNTMQQFRQGLSVGRNEKENGPPWWGRSRWPEADSIRKLAGTHIPRHEPEDVWYFPRAEFGLPIVFHFKQDEPPLPVPDQDPADHTLESALPGASRLASPFILKPLALSRELALPMVLFLDSPRYCQVPGVSMQLQPEGADAHAVPLAQNDLVNRACAATVTPIDTYDPADRDPRYAFLSFVENDAWINQCARGSL